LKITIKKKSGEERNENKITGHFNIMERVRLGN
jgi:hypothetical protein